MPRPLDQDVLQAVGRLLGSDVFNQGLARSAVALLAELGEQGVDLDEVYGVAAGFVAACTDEGVPSELASTLMIALLLADRNQEIRRG